MTKLKTCNLRIPIETGRWENIPRQTFYYIYQKSKCFVVMCFVYVLLSVHFVTLIVIIVLSSCYTLCV